MAQAAPNQTVSMWKAPRHTLYDITLPPRFPFPPFYIKEVSVTAL